MAKGHEVLEALADRMERNGADPARVDIVRRAQRFKRSWVELAEGLYALRKSRRFQQWARDPDAGSGRLLLARVRLGR
jgi:hypothetical protein